MRQLNRKSNQFGIDLTPQTPQSTGLERVNDQLSNPINPQGGAISSIGNMFGGSTRQKQTNDPFRASGSQAYDQATSLGAIQPDMIRDNFSSGMMMKSPLKELSSESLVSPFTMSPLEGNAFTKAMKDTGGNYEKAQEMLKNE